jgi:ribosomal protein S12 methylthiotransferase accessory factor
MMETIKVTFPGGTLVTAYSGGFEIKTDQPIEDGGANSAPEPYILFLSSIVTCAGYYVLRFCQQRELLTEGLTMSLDIERNSDSRRLEKIKLGVQLPEGFPEKYKKAVIRSAEMCSVKKALMDPPEFEIITG